MNNLNKIFNQGILVDLTVRYWTGQRKLSQADLGFNGEVSRELISLGKKNLIPPEVRKEFRRIESKARYYLEQVSFPFPMGNAKFVPETAIPELIESFNEWKKDYAKAITSLVRRYDTIHRKSLANFEKKMPEIYKITQHDGDYEKFTQKFMATLRTLYPDKSEIRDKFGFEWSFFEINLPNYKKRSGKFLSKQADENAKIATEYRNKANKEINGFLNDVVGELRSQTVKTVGFVAGKIKKGEVITETNLNSLRKFIDRFENLNFVGDKTIHNQLQDLRKNYLNGAGIQYKNNQTATNQLKNKLDGIMDVCKDLSDISTVTGNWKRRIKI